MHEVNKGFGGIGCVKLLRYYGTKALRSNRNVGRHYQTDTKIDKGANTNYNSNMMNYKSQILRKNRTFFTKSKILEKVVKRVQDDKKTHFTHYTHVKKAAFTLAEVLITLGIIGIVAAMTIPTLVSKIQEAHFHAKWKECYAILNNAFKMVVAENPRMVVAPGSDTPYGDAGPTKEFIDAFLSYLHVVDTCGYRSFDNKTCEENSPLYYWDYKSLSGVTLSPYDFNFKSALLKNGASIHFGGLWSGITIVVDVNNYKSGPNILGKDVYAINLTGNLNYNIQYVESLFFRPYGDTGTKTETSGHQGCDENIQGSEIGNGVALYEAAGAGCSYKYLHEK